MKSLRQSFHFYKSAGFITLGFMFLLSILFCPVNLHGQQIPESVNQKADNLPDSASSVAYPKVVINENMIKKFQDANFKATGFSNLLKSGSLDSARILFSAYKRGDINLVSNEETLNPADSTGND